MTPGEQVLQELRAQKAREGANFKPVGTEELNRRLAALTPPKPSKKDLLAKTTNVVNTVFPGKQIGESLVKAGTNIANLATGGREKFMAGLDENRINVPALIGDYTQAGLNLGIGGAATAAKAPTLLARGASLGKTVAKGAAAGYGLDVTQSLKEGETDASVLTPGLGTAIGAAIPAGLATATGVKNVLGRGISEVSGSLTGQGYGGQKMLIDAIEAGGNRAKIAKAAMRGGFAPEQIKEEADQALNIMYSKRATEYQGSLAKLEGNKQSYDISPIIGKVQKGLDDFKVGVTPAGELDFSQSPIRFNKKAQQDIMTIFEEMRDFGTRPGDRTVVGLDSLKRAFSDLYTESGEARKFVSDISKEVRTVLNEVPGYKDMSAKYAKSTELINDIRKNLAVGNGKSIDSAYKKMLTVVRADTDTRMQLLRELDEASDGKLLPMVAGELSKTWLPRGLSRYFTGGAAGFGFMGAGGEGVAGTAVLGSVFKAILIAGLSTSPRIAGEVTTALGLSRRYTKPVAKALNSMLLQFQANKAITGLSESEQP